MWRVTPSPLVLLDFPFPRSFGDLGMQYRRKKALEKYLNEPTLGTEILVQSPLAAAEYSNQPHRASVSQLCPSRLDHGRGKTAEGWGTEYADLTVCQGDRPIDQSKYRIVKANNERYRETVGVTFISKIKDKLRGERVVTP